MFRPSTSTNFRFANVAPLAGLFILLPVSWSLSNDDHGSKISSISTTPRASTVKRCSAWMSRVPDDALLSQLSIPGTHDSCALRNGSSFGFAKCQSWKLADQLNAGVRFIDIRCRHVDNDFQIYHGIIDQKMKFSAVRDVCREFLKRHPSECIVMSIKQESTPKNNSRKFAATFSNITRGDGKLWRIKREAPMLGDARGQIVVIDRIGTLGGLPWRKLKLQDDYQADLERKATLIREHIAKAQRADKGSWFINFCSGTLPSKLLTPKIYAAKSNQVALDCMLKIKQKSPSRLGTIVMDFPTEELVERIVDTNFAADKSGS